MDINILRNRSFIYSFMSGALIGLAVFFIKIPISSGLGFLGLISNPLVIISVFLAVLGFYFMQKSFYSGFVSISISVISGLSIIIPVSLANIFLNEVLGLDLIGVILIVLGVFFLVFSARKA